MNILDRLRSSHQYSGMKCADCLAGADEIERLRAALAICAAKFTRDVDDQDAAAGELARRMQVAFNALNGLDLNNGLTVEQSSAPVRSTRPCEVCDGYHIIGSPCPVDGHRHT